MSKEEIKLALEALAVKFSEGWHEGIKIDASDIMLLNDAAQALAEPDFWEGYVPEPVKPAQQEPVACKTLCELCAKRGYIFCANAAQTTPIPSPPAQRKPLTDEEIDAEFDAFASKFDHESNEWLDMGVDAYFRAGFKAAHGIKENT
jgi:hypothetical protein